MSSKLFRGKVEVDVRYEIKDDDLFVSLYDMANCLQRDKGTMYWEFPRDLIEVESRSGCGYKSIRAAKASIIFKKILRNDKTEGFLSWLEDLVKEHKDEIKASAHQKETPAMEIVQKVDNVIPMVRTAENSNLSGIAEDIVIDCYLGTNIPAETRELVKSFLMTVKRRTSSYSALG